MPAGCTPITQYLMEQSAPIAFRRVFAENGSPLDTLDMRFVNGQMYTRLRPLIRPDKPSTTLPPVFVLKLATRLHPEMRRRNRLAGEAFAAKPWNDVIAEWNNGGKSRIEAANAALQNVDTDALDADGLIAHVNRCVDHCRAQLEHHFWLHGFDLAPLGQFLHEAISWGLDPNEVLSLLEGASPSTSAPARELSVIRAAVEAAGAEPRSLDDLRAVSPSVADRVDAYLTRRGHVLFSRYDLDGVTLGERPDLVVASILNAEHVDTSDAVSERIEAMRTSLPEQRRAEFDELLAEARAAMDLRDDNGPVTSEWPLGVLRMALLALGRRLVAAGTLSSPELVFELQRAEVSAALLGGSPDDATLQRRARHRASLKSVRAPDVLGPPEAAPPLDVLPSHMARVAAMVQTVVKFMGMDGTAGSDPLQGSGIGSRSVTGTARLATNPEDALDALQPGDILVVAGTTPAYNLVLSLAAAVVTADGGPMSHAAVIARELGIPAVVGARGALTDIPDGATIEVDPVAGRVRVLSVV
jgi:pyruvate,water dikinase